MGLARTVAVVIAMGLAVRALLWGVAGPQAAVRTGTATFDEVVALAAAAVAFAVMAWVGVVLVVTTLAALPGAIGGHANRLAARIAPGLAGRLARVALGLTLTAGPLAACTPALGSSGAQSPEVVAAGVAGDSGLPGVGRIGSVITPTVPEPRPTAEPTGGEPTAIPPVPAPTAGLAEVAAREQQPAGEVVVMRGDTLWAIAARHLGPDITAADIAAEWPRWYAANREVIGEDPDLISPGMVLRAPAVR